MIGFWSLGDSVYQSALTTHAQKAQNLDPQRASILLSFLPASVPRRQSKRRTVLILSEVLEGERYRSRGGLCIICRWFGGIRGR